MRVNARRSLRLRGLALAMVMTGCNGSIASSATDAGPGRDGTVQGAPDAQPSDGAGAVDSPPLADAGDDGGAAAAGDAGGVTDAPAADAPLGPAGPCKAGTVHFEVRSGGGVWLVCFSADAPNAPGANDFTVFSSTGAQQLYLASQGYDCQSCNTNGYPIGFGCTSLADGGGGSMSVDGHTWDGTYYAQSTCGHGAACFTQACAPPGPYLAKICVCPQAEWDATAMSYCSQFTCLDVPFTFPSSTPIQVVLPAQ
jgi:hypothetical protein